MGLEPCLLWSKPTMACSGPCRLLLLAARSQSLCMLGSTSAVNGQSEVWVLQNYDYSWPKVTLDRSSSMSLVRLEQHPVSIVGCSMEDNPCIHNLTVDWTFEANCLFSLGLRLADTSWRVDRKPISKNGLWGGRGSWFQCFFSDTLALLIH